MLDAILESSQAQQSGGGNQIVGAENLCHQAILVNHASGAVAPPDAEVLQVGDTIGQRAERRGLFQGAVRPVRV